MLYRNTRIVGKIQNIIFAMFLRANNKENILLPLSPLQNQSTLKSPRTPSASKLSQASPKEQTFQECASEFNDTQATNKFLEEEVNRLRQLYELERNQKWDIAQEKAKLEGQIKILQVERDHQFSQNQRIKTQLRDLVSKAKESQERSNIQTQDNFRLSNENNLLKIQISQLKQKFTQLEQDYTQLAKSYTSSENINKEQASLLKKLEGENGLKNVELDVLRNKIIHLENQNRRLLQEVSKKSEVVPQSQISKVSRQLQNWKTVLEKKELEFAAKITLLQQENSSLKNTLSQVSDTEKVKQVQRACSLPADLDTSDKNTQHIRLFVKESQIEKLTQQVKSLEEQAESLRLQNALLSKKLSQGTVFSPAGYQKYTQVQNAILRNSETHKHVAELKIELQSKEKQVEALTQNLQEVKQSLESALIQYRKLEAEFESQNITHQNQLNSCTALKTKLERDFEMLKSKVQYLQKECQEKDKIILNHVKSKAY